MTIQSERKTVTANDLVENQISGMIVAAAIEVHQYLGGPGLLEGVYEESLCQELNLRRVPVKRQVHQPIYYKGEPIGAPLRIDLLVADRVIVEVKATEVDLPLYRTQLLTYLRLSRLKLGVLLNFGKSKAIDGVSRVVNGL